MRDAVATMGDILPDDVGGRDAVHVAVIAAAAEVKVYPGQNIGFKEGWASPYYLPLLGIVDPFLKAPVEPDQRFWLYLYPRTITGLNHHWTHPAFPDAVVMTKGEPVDMAKLQAEARLRNFAQKIGATYEDVLSAITTYDADGYLNFGTGDSGSVPDDFWDNAEIVLGKVIEGHTDYYSCAC